MRYLFLLLMYVFPAMVSAAEISITPSDQVLGVGETYIAQVSLYTEGAMVNAVEGTIEIPSLLSVTDIRLSRSLVPYWVESPREVAPGVVSFAGLLPGGYQNGEKTDESEGNLFTLVLTAKDTGEASVVISPSTIAYLNDGEGTSLTLDKSNATITIASEGTGSSASVALDSVPPESFEVEILDGTYVGQEGKVVVFNAIDKDSGVEGYEIARSLIWLPDFLRSYSEVISPASLNGADTFGIVWVRAHDRYDNYTTTQLSPSGMFGYLLTLVVVILILVLLVHLILRKKAIITS